MEQKKKPSRPLEEKKEHLIMWIDRHKEASEIVPYVQMNLEMTEWQIQALNDLPNEASEKLPDSITDRFEKECESLKMHLPVIPEYDKSAVLSELTTTTSGSGVVHGVIFETRDMGSPEATKYSEKYITAYKDIQEKQDRSDAVHDLLKNSQMLQRYERASKAYFSAKSGAGERTSAALEMRNLIDQLKGELWESARRSPRENMNWEIMADRLFEGELGGTQHQELLERETINSQLLDNLSNILKDREGNALMSLDDIWTQLLDHIYIILNLVKLRV